MFAAYVGHLEITKMLLQYSPLLELGDIVSILSEIDIWHNILRCINIIL